MNPPPPPLTSLSHRSCADAPSLNAARPLVVGAEDPVVVEISETTDCVRASDGSRATYVLFALSGDAQPHYIQVESRILGGTVFAPQITMLDAYGTPLRSLQPGDFMVRGSTLSAAVFPATQGAPERYLLVSSHAMAVGTEQKRIVQGVNTTTMPVYGGGVVAWNSGSDTEHGYTYAHNGQVAVHAKLLPSLKPDR